MMISLKKLLFAIIFISIAIIISVVGYLYFAKQQLALAQTQNIYWVDDDGIATWANCSGSTPLSGTSACSLATANTNAVAGDIINMRGGIYTNQTIQPSNSGTSEARIVYQAYAAGETPILDDTGEVVGPPYGYGVLIDRKDYITIDGIEIRNQEYLVTIQNGADYNEVKNSVIHDPILSLTMSAGVAVAIKDPQANDGGSNHNWIHRNTIYRHGQIDSACNDAGGLIVVALDNEFISQYNTIEDNILYHGGHYTLQTNSPYNVVRNNISRNDAWMNDNSPGCDPITQQWRATNKWGNRNFAIGDGNNREGLYNLIENNRLGYGSNPPDGGGAEGINLTGKKMIIRYNTIIEAGEKGLYFKQVTGGDSDNNRAYNNTVFKNGYSYDQLGNVSYGSIYIHTNSQNNIIKNNLVYDYAPSTNEIYGSYITNTIINNWVTANGDPKFVDTSGMPSTTDATGYDFSVFATVPNLNLQFNSGAINAGMYLTQSNGSGSNSTTLIVDDALYFQDGSWGSALSNIQPDWIAIGTVNNNVVQISSIDYSTNTIILTSPMSWSDNANIWLYKNSSGNVVLSGSAPDIGAYEYVEAAPPPDTTSSSAPTGLVIE